MRKLEDMETKLINLEMRIVKLEEGQKALDRRIDSINESLSTRIEDTNRRIEGFKGLIYVMLGGIVALIGFILWDRRTALLPVIKRVKSIEEEKDLTLRALREYARTDPKMAEILRSLGLL